MDRNQDMLKKAVKHITDSRSFLICLSDQPSDDSVAAATCLYLSLIKLGKSASIVTAGEVDTDIVGAEKIKNELSITGDNLVISLPYKEDAIDKIDYFIQGDKLNIVVSPSSSNKRVEPEEVEFNQSGGDVDCILTIDVDSLKRLGFIYSENEAFFKDKDIINIDRHITNSHFGKINVIDKSSSSTSELILKLLKDLNVKIDKDISTNLYFGIRAATNNFSSFSVSPETLETAAFLLRQGASKKTNNFINKPNIFNKRQRSIDMVEKEIQGKETEEDQELKPKIFRPGS
ncbi:MAG: DHH family phosphoesterase [Patescibacteria group bacterium]